MSRYGNYPPPPPEPQKPRQINDGQIGFGCLAIVLFGIVCIGIGVLIDKFLL